MQFGQIEAFVAIAKHGSISRAAEELCLTQPTVTERLRALEEELGDRLFTRVKYGVTLTEAGKALLPYAKRVLKTLADGRSAVEGLREATRGTLYIGSAPFISMYILPALLARYAARYPHVHVVVHTGHSEEVLEMVLREEVQIGLARKMRHPEIETTLLHRDELVLVAPPGHDFAARASVSIEELAHEGVVLFDRSTSYHKLVNAIFMSVGLVPKATFEMDNVEAAKKIVEQGLGIALLPRISIQREVSLGTIKVVPIKDSPPLARELVAIHRRSVGLGGIARAFLGEIEDEVAGQVPLAR